MGLMRHVDVVVVLPVGPGCCTQVLDTLESLRHYLDVPYHVIAIDDATDDGTYDALKALGGESLTVLRNEARRGWEGLIQSICPGLVYALENFQFPLLARIDHDALLVAHGLIGDVSEYASRNPQCGIIGKFALEFDGSPERYDMHTRRIHDDLKWRTVARHGLPWYYWIAARAVWNGWPLGQNVLGAGFFFTAECLRRMWKRGLLEPRVRGPAWLVDDVYWTMCAYAVGLTAGHFAAPHGPLAVAWRKLPLPGPELYSQGYKLVHSVDRGRNTGHEENGGSTAREFFRRVREADLPASERPGPGSVNGSPGA
jgi:hypothetical protein